MQENIITGELTEIQSKRLDILKRYAQNERSISAYDFEEGTFDVKISQVLLKTNSNGKNFIEFVCRSINGNKKMYAIYYITEGTDESSITDLRCLLHEYNESDFTDYEIIDDCKIAEKLKVLIGKTAKLVVEKQDGFTSCKLYKEIIND